MTIRHLKVFIKVCELNSISKTAEEFCIAQPSVSQTIQDLENYYNVHLFNRVGKKIALTEQGTILLAKAKQVVKEFDDFENIANDKDIDLVVNVGTTLGFAHRMLIDIIEMLDEGFPNLKTSFFVSTPQQIEEKLLSGELDFAFTEKMPNSSYLLYKQVKEGEIVLCASKGNKYPNYIKLEDLNNYPLILREEGSPIRKILENELEKRSIKKIKPRIESISNYIIGELISKQIGIGALPLSSVQRLIKDSKVKIIKTDVKLKRPLYVVYNKARKFNSTCKKAYEIALKMISDYREE